MSKQKTYVCGYSSCLHDKEPIPSEIAVKDGNRYYHEDCLKDKQNRQKVFELYYKYYKSTEDFVMVRKAISEYSSNFGSEYILYVLCQAIHTRIPFKGIFTLGWLCKNNMDIKKKYSNMKSKKQVSKYNFDDVEIRESEVNEIVFSNNKKAWTDTLFG